MTNPNNLQVTYYPTVDLRLYHRNPRIGNTSRIADSLRINGQYKPVVVNRGTHTGRPNEVLAGNHTLKAARDLGWDTIAAVTIDVDDDQAARIVAADNRTSDLGSYDDRLLLELLTDLPNLDGTGYDPGDIDALEAILNDTTDVDDLDTLADELSDGNTDDLYPVLRLKIPPILMAAWKSHLDTHHGDEIHAFAALLNIDPAELPE